MQSCNIHSSTSNVLFTVILCMIPCSNEVLYGSELFLHWSRCLKPHFSTALPSAISPHAILTPGEVILSWDFNIAIQISLPPRLHPRLLFGVPPNIYTCLVSASISQGYSRMPWTQIVYCLNRLLTSTSPSQSLLYVMIWCLEKPSIRLLKPEISFFFPWLFFLLHSQAHEF